MREIIRTIYIGDGKGETKTEVYSGMELDTRVKIGDQTICWVRGNDREKFVDELINLVDKYRI